MTIDAAARPLPGRHGRGGAPSRATATGRIPGRSSRRAHYAMVLQALQSAEGCSGDYAPIGSRARPAWRDSAGEVWPRYWWRMAATWHMLGEYHDELDITDRWRDSAASEWQVMRGRALGALGREREVMDLLGSTAEASRSTRSRSTSCDMATELAVHGHPADGDGRLPRASWRGSSSSRTRDWSRASNIAWANRLLGRKEHEREALEQIARSDADTLAKLEADGPDRRAARPTPPRPRGSTASWRSRSNRPLRNPWIRGCADPRPGSHRGWLRPAGTGCRPAPGRERSGDDSAAAASYAFHDDLLLAPLRGYPPFEALLKPDN